MISIIVPTYNERGNIPTLLKRISKLFSNAAAYEIIVIDDNSNDGTWELLQDERAKSKYPVIPFRKESKTGKAYSLIEGFAKATGDILVMIDADLQYPPKAIPGMLNLAKNYDIVVANRKNYYDSKIRKFLSRTFRFCFGKVLFGLNCDVQSGLKVFRKEVAKAVQFKPKSAWAFDLEFLHLAKNAGFKIANFDITFNPRTKGNSSIATLKNGAELAKQALILRTKRIHPQHIPPQNSQSMKGAGIGFKKIKYITHTTLSHHHSAIAGFLFWQKLAIGIILASVGISFYFTPLTTAVILVGILSTIYFADLIFNLFLITKSLTKPPEIVVGQQELDGLLPNSLPVYSILCPLYHEAALIPQFLQAMEALDWPKEKLDVQLLLEEDDRQTIEAIAKIALPPYVRKVIVPQSQPKTKPKACNYGLATAKGKYLVIYDAEDIPEPTQLKKTYIAFKKVPENVICLQAKLNYYNPHQNLITRFFTAEYSLWFDVILTGLQSIQTTIPLGGTSNHFKTCDLLSLQGWDPFNVTEDADLGVRLFAAGFKTAMIDSTTFEEANSKLTNWFRQRSRWIKGYLQTYFVHMRNPVNLVKTQGIHSVIFQLVVGGKIAFMFINPFLWVATIAYFALYSLVGPAIESLYPAQIFYMAVASLVFGNFMFLYYYMIGCAKRNHWSLIKYVFFVPFYWLGISFAATIALYQLIVKPHYWEKTIHGFHLAKEEEQKEAIRTQAAQERLRKIKVLVGSGTAAGSVLMAASVVGNFLNFAYNAYLGRAISLEDFGLVSLVGSFFYIVSIPLGSFSKTITHRSAYLFGKYETPVKEFWRSQRKRALWIGLAVTALWLILSPALVNFFRAPSLEPFILFAPVWFIGTLTAVDGGFLAGSLKFQVVGILLVAEALAKLFITLILVESGHGRFVYAAVPASTTVTLIIGWLFARSIKEQPIKTAKKILRKFPVHFFISSNFVKISTVAFLSFDVILAKHYLPPKEAGEYALLALVGKIIFFIGGLFSQFINPLVSRAEGARKNSKLIFYKLFFASSFISFLTYVAVGFFGSTAAPILFGQKVRSIVYLLPIYGLAMFCFATANSVVSFYQLRRKHLFAYISLLFAIIQIVGISKYHNNLNQIVSVMTVVGVGSLIVMLLLHAIYEPLAAITRNIKDFIDLFKFSSKQIEIRPDILRVLIFNWRDIKHVWAGGAEVYIHELAKRLVQRGHEVTVFCSNDGKSSRSEIINGVQIVRRGGFYTVYFWAFLYYILKFRGRYDIIIDSENGIPFFTPLYIKKPIIGLVHHIHQEVFRKGLIFPLARLAQFLESTVMPFLYKNVRLVTVSNSSKKAFEEIGLGKKYPIEVVNPGVDLNKFKPAQKTDTPSIIYLGRLKPYKSIETAIYAVSKVAKKIPTVTFTIAGDGESRANLESLVKKLGLAKVIKFAGHVSEKTKRRLLAQSWLVVQPSMMEGWGITTIEANASGTPVIAANVPGLRDSVSNPHSGFLVPWGDAEKFAEKIETMITDKKIRKTLEIESIQWASQFSWDKSTKKIITILQNQT